MNWEAIGAIGEIAGAVAVVTTLFYLARQMRQTQRTERAVSQRDLLLRVSEWARFVNCEDSDRFVTGLHNYNEAEARTQGHIDTCLSEFIFIAEAALNMRNDGFFSDGTWNGIIGATLALIRTPGGSQWWEYGRKFIGTEIVEFLDKELTRIDPATSTYLDFTPATRKRIFELGLSDPED